MLWEFSVALLLIVLIFIGTVLYFYRARIIYLDKKFKLQQQEIDEFIDGNPEVEGEDTNTISITDFKFDKKYEISLEELQYDLKDVLGSGHFGIVYKGTLTRNDSNPIPVAVKMLKTGAIADNTRDLMREWKVIQFIKSQKSDNINIIQVFGAYTKDMIKNQILVVMEYCPRGNLQDYLRKMKANLKFGNMVNRGVLVYRNRQKESDYESPEFSTLELIKWASEIANGMQFLAKLNIVHGDLAARNVLIDDTLIAKISDFGLSKTLQTPNYTRNRTLNIAIDFYAIWQWLAPECHTQYMISLASDVWSFGVTLWEIFSLGDVPYPGLKYGPAFITMITNGFRMSLPTYATYDMHNMMLRCWEQSPSDRPNFTELYKELTDINVQEESSTTLASEEVEDAIDDEDSLPSSTSDWDVESISLQESTLDD